MSGQKKVMRYDRPLSKTEKRLFKCLESKIGKPVSVKELIAAMLSDDSRLDDSNISLHNRLRVYISRMRKVLKATLPHFEIATIFHRRYNDETSHTNRRLSDYMLLKKGTN